MRQHRTGPWSRARPRGRPSNYSADVKPGGAIDVSDEARFAELMAACPYSPRIFNNLSADRRLTARGTI